MEILPSHVLRFKTGLERILDSLLEPQLIDDVYVFFLEERKLCIYYYPPGTLRIINHPNNSSALKYIHIDEDNWLSKPDLLLSRIEAIIGNGVKINARECVAARIDKKMALDFQEEHHLQLAVPGKYRYGLFHDGELVAIAIFSGGRTMRHSENYRSFEFIRFCSKQRHIVVGGMSKLLHKFIQDFSPNDIMTYVDLDWSDGKKFEGTGFVSVDILEPQTFWVHRKTHQRISNNEYKGLSNKDDYYQVATLGSTKMVKYCRVN